MIILNYFSLYYILNLRKISLLSMAVEREREREDYSAQFIHNPGVLFPLYF